MSAVNDAAAFWTCPCGEDGNSLLDGVCVRCGECEPTTCPGCREPLDRPADVAHGWHAACAQEHSDRWGYDEP